LPPVAARCDAADVPHKVIDVFDRLAPQWDQVLPFFAAMAAQVAAAIPLVAGSRVLDLGAGTGAMTAQALARGSRVAAVDAAPAMITRLRRDHPRAAAMVMDAHQLAFADASFDIVAAGFVMHLFDDPGAAAREARRVLAPGGLLALTLPGPPPGTPPSPVDRLWAEFNREFSRYLPPGGGTGQPIDPVTLLDGAGFTGIAAQPAEVNLPMPGGGETHWQWHLTHGTIAFIDSLPAERREEFRQRLIAAVDAAGTGTLHATATLWTARAGTA
jgi:ubiquinone/menaquinone biosynthesis C-methylase UbiE